MQSLYDCPEVAMYISVNDAATKFNISKRRVQLLCEQGRISGANMVSGVWLIPETAPKPVDGRKKRIDDSQLSFFDVTQKGLTVDDVCKTLSISKAEQQKTGFAWVRLPLTLAINYLALNMLKSSLQNLNQAKTQN